MVGIGVPSSRNGSFWMTVGSPDASRAAIE
jgi:hypothetical protein